MFKTLTPSSLSPTKPSLFMKLSGLPSLSSKLFASAFDENITSDRQSSRLVTRLVYFARVARQSTPEHREAPSRARRALRSSQDDAPSSMTTVLFGSLRLISVISPDIVPKPIEMSCFKPLKSIFASSSSSSPLEEFFAARATTRERARSFGTERDVVDRIAVLHCVSAVDMARESR